MIERLKRRAHEAGVTNLETIVGDATYPHVPEASFDHVFLCTALGEIPDRTAALTQCYRALKPGGVLSITEMFGDPHYQTGSVVRRLAEEVGFRLQSVTWLALRRAPGAVPGADGVLAPGRGGRRPAGRAGPGPGAVGPSGPQRHLTEATALQLAGEPGRAGPPGAIRRAGCPVVPGWGPGRVPGWRRTRPRAPRPTRSSMLALRLPEPRLARDLAAALPAGSLLWAASSLRLLAWTSIWSFRGWPADPGQPGRQRHRRSSRSPSAIGAALAHQGGRGGPAAALLGDLAFLHDAPGLFLGLIGNPGPDLVIVVVNNGRGRDLLRLGASRVPGTVRARFRYPAPRPAGPVWPHGGADPLRTRGWLSRRVARGLRRGATVSGASSRSPRTGRPGPRRCARLPG